MSRSAMVRAAVGPFMVMATLCAAAWGAMGSGIDFFAATLLLATMAAPIVAGADRSPWTSALATAAMVDATGLAWLAAVIGGPVGWTPWLGCYAILTAWSAGLWGLSRVATRAIGSGFAGPTVATLGLAWLTWPIWLSAHLSGQWTGVTWLVRLHPWLAMNTLLAPATGVWSEQPFAYHWTNLNQDLPYSLPTPAWAIGVFTAVGLAGALSAARSSRRTRRSAPPAT